MANIDSEYRQIDQIYSQDIGMHQDTGYDLLDALTRPDSINWGQPNFPSLYAKLDHRIDDKGFAVLAIGGESVSGKSRIARTLVQEFAERNRRQREQDASENFVHAFILGWGDTITMGKHVVMQTDDGATVPLVDEHTKLGALQPHEHDKVTDLVYDLTQRIKGKNSKHKSLVIIDAPLVPGIEVGENGNIQRANDAVRRLISEDSAFVVFDIADPRIISKGLKERILRNGNPALIDNSAPPEGVLKMQSQVNERLFNLLQNGKLSVPPYYMRGGRRLASPVINSPDDIEHNPHFRQIILLPALGLRIVRDQLEVPEERGFIAFNKYKKDIDPSSDDPSYAAMLRRNLPYRFNITRRLKQ